MKFIAAVLLVACISYAQANLLSEEEKAKLKEFKRACITETKVDESLVKKSFYDGDFTDDASLKAFYVCFFKKAEFINADGKLKIESIKIALTRKYGDEIAQKVIDECTKDTHDDANEIGFNLAKCTYKTVPKEKH